MKQLNPQAGLMKECLRQYTAWLARQRAAAQASGAPQAAAEAGCVGAPQWDGPPVGAFTHREAVDAWLRLIHKVINAGLWFLLKVGGGGWMDGWRGWGLTNQPHSRPCLPHSLARAACLRRHRRPLQEQLDTIVGWATTGAVTPYDSGERRSGCTGVCRRPAVPSAAHP